MANIFEINRVSNKITLGTVDTIINIASHTASKILALDASKNLEVVTIGSSLDYTRPTLNTIQDIRTSATPTFAGLIIADGGTIGQAAGPLLTFNDTNNILEITGCNIGVGMTPDAKFTLISDLGVDPPFGDLHFVKEDGFLLSLSEVYSSDSAGHSPQFILRRARGSLASPDAIVENDAIGGLFFRGYDGTNFQQRAGIKAIVDGAVSASIVPTALVFSSGTTSLTERMKITSSGNIIIPGNVIIGGTVPLAALHIKIPAAGIAALDFEDVSSLAIYIPAATTTGYYQPLIGVGEAGFFTAAICSFDDGTGAAQGLTFHTGNVSAITERLRIDSTGGIKMLNLKSGTTQGGAGAAANELWVDTDDDNTIKLGT